MHPRLALDLASLPSLEFFVQRGSYRVVIFVAAGVLVVAVGLWREKSSNADAMAIGSRNSADANNSGGKAVSSGSQNTADKGANSMGLPTNAGLQNADNKSSKVSSKPSSEVTAQSGQQETPVGVRRTVNANNAANDVGKRGGTVPARTVSYGERDAGPLFFEVFNLDDATQAKIIKANTEYEQREKQLTLSLRRENIGNSQVQQTRADSYRRYEQEIVGELGQDAGRYFIELQSARLFLPITSDFAAQCATAGEPLDARIIASIAINLSQNLPNPDFPPQRVLLPNGVEVHENNAMTAAAKVLTPTQMEIFKKLWARKPYPETPLSPARP